MTLLRRPSIRIAVFTSILVIGAASRSEAGPTGLQTQFRPRSQSTTAATPGMKISKEPHLVAIGPMNARIQPVAGPRVRRAPRLPRPKPIEPDSDAAVKALQTEEAAQTKTSEPSVFSPDAPPTLLPTEKPSATPAPVRKEEPTESVLVPATRGEPDLKDSVLYFETPVGPRGAQISVPAVVPLTSPASVPQPPSSATYRKEKE